MAICGGIPWPGSLPFLGTSTSLSFGDSPTPLWVEPVPLLCPREGPITQAGQRALFPPVTVTGEETDKGASQNQEGSIPQGSRTPEQNQLSFCWAEGRIGTVPGPRAGLGTTSPIVRMSRLCSAGATSGPQDHQPDSPHEPPLHPCLHFPPFVQAHPSHQTTQSLPPAARPAPQ